VSIKNSTNQSYAYFDVGKKDIKPNQNTFGKNNIVEENVIAAFNKAQNKSHADKISEVLSYQQTTTAESDVPKKISPLYERFLSSLFTVNFKR
jgi:hypothetical protein